MQITLHHVPANNLRSSGGGPKRRGKDCNAIRRNGKAELVSTSELRGEE